ncbi:MAG TPA: hypothetical protein DC054_21320 [Blastocatellia bacterium]|nr:hypothetical protein [Blastocatellia bacterium]
MSDVLLRIKRAVLTGHYAFSEKARTEMKIDGDGLAIYTKGKFVREAELETYYFLISSKRAL